MDARAARSPAVPGIVPHVIVAAMSQLSVKFVVFTAVTAIGSGCGSVVRPQTSDGGGGELDAPIDADRAADASGALVDAPPAGPSVVTLAAGTPTKKMGAGGGAATSLCPSGQALIGFTGANGPFSPPLVGVLSGTCGTLSVDGTAAPAYAIIPGAGTMLPASGTGNSTPWAMPCPSNQFVVGATVRVGSSLDNFALQCAPVSLVRAGAAWSGLVGTITVTQGQGGQGGSADAATCEAGQVATGYLTEVNGPSMAAVGLQCSVVTAQ